MSASLSTARGWKRHFEGWELAVLASSLALAAAALAIPRAVSPREIPLPSVDRSEERRTSAVELERLKRAEARPLPYLVRAAGDALRQLGIAEAGSDADLVESARADFEARIGDARRRFGDGPLLDLRAVQTSLFVRAVMRCQSTHALDADLRELGGSFLARGARTGWIDQDGKILLSAGEAASLFTIRWTKLAGLLETRPFSPTLNEWRLYYRTLMAHSPLPTGGDGKAPWDPSSVLGYIDGLVKYDPDYPELLARGVVAYWAGHYADATELFASHLRRHASGPWRLRAQNYLLASYAHVPH